MLSVGSIAIVILLLLSDRGWHNGLGYMLGYVGSYTLTEVSVVLAAYTVPVFGLIFLIRDTTGLL